MRAIWPSLVVLAAVWPVAAAAQHVAVANQPTAAPGAKTYAVFFRVDSASVPTILDVTDDPKGVKPTQGPDSVSRSAERSFWKTEWPVNAINGGASMSRAFLVTAGSLKEMLTVNVSRGSRDVSVTLVSPTLPLRVPDARMTSFQISTTGSLTGVKVVASGLADKRTSETVPVSDLQLTDAGGKGATADGLNLPAGAPSGSTVLSGATIQLRIAETFKEPGLFAGPVRLRSNEKEDLGVIEVTVHSTSDHAKRTGEYLLALGILIFLLVTIVIKGITRRNLLILPAARLRQDALSLKASLSEATTETGFTFPAMLGSDPASLASLIDSLTVANLAKAGYLGFKVAIPFTAPDTSVASYQTFLTTCSNRLAVQTVVIRTGVEAVVEMWKEANDASAQPDAMTAMTALDNLGVAGGTPDMFRSQIQAIITTLRAAINTKSAKGGGPVASTIIASPTPQQLSVAVEVLSGLMWSIWAVLTFVAGAAVMIWFNDSFGTAQDLLQCFLWGVGVPAVTQGFGGLTTSSAATALSLQIPR